MEDDAAVREADLLFGGNGSPSSDDEASDNDQDLVAGHSAEEESEEEGLDEEEDNLFLGDGSRALKRPREETSGDEDEEGANTDLMDTHPRKRGLEFLTRDYSGLDEDEEDDSDDSDEDYSPSSWFCVNCTFKTGDEYTFCAICGEHRRSGILQRGFVASPDIPGDAGVAEDGPLYVPQPVQLTEEEWSRATAIGTDDRMLLHFDEGKEGGSPHPERPDRLRAIIAGLVHSGLFPGRCVPFKPREADRAEIESVHTSHHVDLVELTANVERKYFTADTYTNPNSCQSARLAAGISADMAAAIATDKLRNGVAVVRPPGHHAESETIMGFCLHNNAAVAAKAAQAAGAKKILIVDWDVHHGNGTQEIFDEDPSVLYVSLHRHDRGAFYPGTGRMYEVGKDAGAGFSVNIPWPCANIGDSDYITAFTRVILPLAYQFCPNMVIVSAGFDAAAGDPLGGCLVSPAGYAHMTSLLKPLAQGRMLIVLEGGYNLRSISSSLAACVKVLLGDSPPPLSSLQPSEEGLAVIAEVSAVQARHWTVLGHQEIQVHPIISGEDEEEYDSLTDARADSNGNRLGDAGEEAGGHVRYWLPAPAIPPALPAPPTPVGSTLPLPNYPPGATSPHTFTRIPSPRHPSLEPPPAEVKPTSAFAQPGPPRSQPQANRPPHVPAMPPPSYVASPVHQPFHYPSPAHPSTYPHPSPAHPSTYHQPSPAHPSNYHHPSPAHPSTYHHPSPAHPSTYHHPSPCRSAMLTSPQHPSQTPSHGYHASPAYTNHPQSIFHPPTASPQHHSVPYVMSTVHLKASAPSAPPTVAPLIPRPMNPLQKRPDVARSPSVQPQPMKKSVSALNLSHVSSPSRVQAPAPTAQTAPSLPEASPAVELVALPVQPAAAVTEQPKA